MRRLAKVPLMRRKPFWLPCRSMCGLILLARLRWNNLCSTEMSVIGRQFAGSFWSPFLGIKTVLVVLQAVGRTFLKRMCKSGQVRSDQLRSGLLADGTLILFSPGAELGQNCLAKTTFSGVTGEMSNTGAYSEWVFDAYSGVDSRRLPYSVPTSSIDGTSLGS